MYSIVYSINCYYCLQSQNLEIGSNDCHISYLPLAHIMERTAQSLFFMIGARIGFFSGDIKNLLGDLQALRPTVFMSVPRLLNKLYDKVHILCIIVLYIIIIIIISI